MTRLLSTSSSSFLLFFLPFYLFIINAFRQQPPHVANFSQFLLLNDDRQFCCDATLFLSWHLPIYRCRSRNFCVSAVLFLCVSPDPAIRRVACIATNLFRHAEQIKYSTIFNLARVIEKWWNSEINYNVKWPRKRNDRQRVTSHEHIRCVYATQWLMNVWMPRSFTTIRSVCLLFRMAQTMTTTQT